MVIKGQKWSYKVMEGLVLDVKIMERYRSLNWVSVVVVVVGDGDLKDDK